MSKTIDYANLMHDAMRGLIQKVLQGIAKDGLPGEHHFFISFDTNNPDVEIADWLSDRYPDEMTIVIQHWFDNLNITDDGFSITLNFGDNPEPLYIPYGAILTFVDPSVEFGLRFEAEDQDEQASRIHEVPSEEATVDEACEAPMHENAVEEIEAKDAEIVSLDSFRKPK